MERLQKAGQCRNLSRSQENPGLKKKPKGKTENRDKKGKQNQDYNKILKIQVQCEELYFFF